MPRHRRGQVEPRVGVPDPPQARIGVSRPRVASEPQERRGDQDPPFPPRAREPRRAAAFRLLDERARFTPDSVSSGQHGCPS